MIGACDDGGYYLLGMRRPHAGLFADIAWSTDTVAAQTRDRAAALGLDLFELPLWYDIDDDASLDRLVQETSGSDTAPWTRPPSGARLARCPAFRPALHGKDPLGLAGRPRAWPRGPGYFKIDRSL